MLRTISLSLRSGRGLLLNRAAGIARLSAGSAADGAFTPVLEFEDPATVKPRTCFRIINEDGKLIVGSAPAVCSEEMAHSLYKCMVRVQAMDKVLFDAQRQGRLSFYMTSAGEEAASVASAAGLEPTDDIFAQYREQGALMWRGHPLEAFVDQCLGNGADAGKGRQMPVHYGSRKLHFQTIKSPLATQIPQASGAAYAHKLEGNKRAVACYFGEGAASEGDFHAGLNFAATLGCPVVFICRNNGWAISTPAREQLHGDGIASRAAGYGMLSSRIDGNDAWAVLQATREARARAVTESRPVLLELMTYRQGHHSTSDDSTRYRSVDEIEEWRTKRHPITRLMRFMVARGWWDETKDKALKDAEREAVLKALQAAEKKPLPEWKESLFGDVYDVLPKNLERQRDDLDAFLKANPGLLHKNH